ncbi:putative transposase [Saccharopolyspora erythraea NRRL 2338]|uniref:Transposase n=2 Tax=Saccharopolyspora erythraea TaxID=1836 RepID=A4FJ91_SACEN|nr:transposase [Saccharopolyspora erythraea]CAM04116.1 putative transposase [Saccharopolyspora erythraea NRRL 2338]
MSERGGIPLAVVVSAANRNDHRELEAVVDSVAPVKVPTGRPRRRPHKLHGDKGYDFPVCPKQLTTRHSPNWRARRSATAELSSWTC